MISQAKDFEEESEAVHSLLAPLGDDDYRRVTQFKSWTIHDVIAHLHSGNCSARMTIEEPDAYTAFLARRVAARERGQDMRAFTNEWLEGLTGRALLAAWREGFAATAAAYAGADPKRRVKWVGPDMSARSSITARLMETWAHAQALYDLLAVERVDTDRIENIAVLGVITFGWAYANRGMQPPGPPPLVRLTAPSGAVWEWNADKALPGERIEGSATEFCQVVTQTRNVADTKLAVTGPTAQDWMLRAQCFAGPPNDPPAPGTRFRMGG